MFIFMLLFPTLWDIINVYNKGAVSMNNNMPNNNGNNNGLNPVSLGSVNNGNVGDIPPVPPVESLNGTDVTPVQPVQAPVNPVPPVEPVSSVPPVNNTIPVTPTVGSVPPVQPVESEVNNIPPVNSVPPVEPVNPIPPVEPVSTIPPVEPITPVGSVGYDIPQAMDQFNTTPVFNEIGTVPPIPDNPIPTPVVNNPEPKPKKKMNKTLFVLIIVLLIAAVGVGVYIFLNVSNKTTTPNVVLKNVEIELGSEVSSNIEDYATFNGIASSSCTLDTSAISTDTLNQEYDFTIVCNGVTYTGKAKIVDTTAPIVEVKEVTVQVGTTVSPEDFIASCSDASECSYQFKNEATVNGYLTQAGTDNAVEIVVTDEAGNTANVTALLNVTVDEVPTVYLRCTLDNVSLVFGIIDGNFSGNVTRSTTFTLEESEYNNLKDTYLGSANITYEDITGTPSFDDSTLTLTVSEVLTKAELDSEEATTLPTQYGELRAYFAGKGYTVGREQP